MKLFLDSAKIDEIRKAREEWGIDGVTTNPKHIYASGKPFRTVADELAAEFRGVDFPISIEIDPYIEDTDTMVDQAMAFSRMCSNFVIKIPCTLEGLAAIRQLSAEGVRTNCTLVFSPSQALQAARAGAYYVSPFLGWKEANGEDTTHFLETVTVMYRNYDFPTEIIVAAVRNGKQIADAAFLGADIVTAGYGVYAEAFTHPYTDLGLQRFREAWDKTATS